MSRARKREHRLGRVLTSSVLYIVATSLGIAVILLSYLKIVMSRFDDRFLTTNLEAPSQLELSVPHECVNKEGDLGFCTKKGAPCYNKWKPPSAHHCSSCGVCQIGFDHHCPWVSIHYRTHYRILRPELNLLSGWSLYYPAAQACVPLRPIHDTLSDCSCYCSDLVSTLSPVQILSFSLAGNPVDSELVVGQLVFVGSIWRAGWKMDTWSRIWPLADSTSRNDQCPCIVSWLRSRTCKLWVAYYRPIRIDSERALFCGSSGFYSTLSVH